jgi:N-acetylmuramoyl-L-alanine amidase
MGLAGIIRRPSDNHGPRREGAVPTMVILHYTGMASAEEAIARLCDPRSQVSCHYLVDEDGHIVAMVEEDRRAWHAGVSVWAGERDINSCSIGIEIHNPGHDLGYRDFPDAQMAAVEALAGDIVARHRIAAHRILAHSDVAPGRKVDPGERFDWARLARAGIGHWVAPEPLRGGGFLQRGDGGEGVEALQALFGVYGYGIEVTGVFDDATHHVVEAFQRHFRQARVDGIADTSTVTTLHRLVAALPASPLA